MPSKRSTRRPVSASITVATEISWAKLFREEILKNSSLIRKSMMSASAAFSIMGGRFLLMAILARRLPSSEFGQFVYAQWLVDISFLICAFGINGAASRYIAEYAHDPPRRAVFLRRWLPWALILPVISGFVVVAGGILSGLPLTPLRYILLAAWGITTGWWSMQTAGLQGHQRFDLILIANVTFLTLVIPAALLIPTGSSFTELLFSAMALSSLFACGFGVRQNITLLAGFSDGEAVDMTWLKFRAYAVNTWLTGVLGSLVWSRGELPLVRAYLGDKGVAQYTVALTLFFGAMQGVMLWVSGVAPHLTSEWGRGQKTQAVAIARRFSDVQLLFSGCVALLLVCFGSDLLGIIFGAAYRTSAPTLTILILGLITVSASAQNHLLQIDTDARFNRNTSLVGLVVLYFVASITIPWLGIAGAAIARALAMWGLFSISLVMVWRSWGSTVLSGRNALVVFFAVSVPAMIMAAGDIHYSIRTLIALACLVALGRLVRGEDGRLVVIDVVSTGWLHLRQWPLLNSKHYDA